MNKFDEEYTKRGAYHLDWYNNDPSFKSYVDDIVAYFKFNVGSVLDVGAGEGLITEKLRDNGVKCDALDVSSVAMDLFLQRLDGKKWKNKVKYFNEDFLWFQKDYDYILLANTIQWADDPTKMIEKAKRLCNFGIYLTTIESATHPLDRQGFDLLTLSKLFPHADISFKYNRNWVVIWNK